MTTTQHPAGVETRPGLAYAAAPGRGPLLLDLHLPARAARPAPVVVHLHGGGWCEGARGEVAAAVAEVEPDPFGALAARGVAVACVDYRLSGEVTWPAALHDVKAAVRWLRAHADEHGLDPERVAAWGESAGAHLACLLALVSDPQLEGEVGGLEESSHVCAVVAWYPPTDLAGLPADQGRPEGADDPGTPEARMLGATAQACPDLAAQASPVRQVRSPGATRPVPFLLRHGDADDVVPLAQSRRLAQALSAAGGHVELQRVLDGHHAWAGRPADARSALDATTDFLLHHLGVPADH